MARTSSLPSGGSAAQVERFLGRTAVAVAAFTVALSNTTLVGKRVVSTASVYDGSKLRAQRFSSSDFGQSWRTASFGNVGARMASLLKVKGQPSLLMEAWHNNAPKGSRDTIRARYELP